MLGRPCSLSICPHSSPLEVLKVLQLNLVLCVYNTMCRANLIFIYINLVQQPLHMKLISNSWTLLKNSCPDDEGSKHLWNDDQFLPDYTLQQPRNSYLHTRRRENLKSNSVGVEVQRRDSIKLKLRKGLEYMFLWLFNNTVYITKINYEINYESEVMSMSTFWPF
jgi:hypothetical protein